MTRPLVHPALAIALLVAAPGLASDQLLVQENFQQADLDADGGLDAAEFKAFIDLNADDNLGRAAMLRDRGMYTQVFQRIDANKDGILSGEEMSRASQR
ncbi:MAG: hypothetical protein AAGA32_12225 [Pseudomonadota bacterium]